MSERQRPSIRLTEDVNTRLERACKRRGLTKQSYILTAVEDALDRDEESLRTRQEDRRPRRDSKVPGESSGLGFGRTLRETSAPKISVAEPAQGLTVNVNTAPTGGGDLVSRLATFVAGGKDDYERQSRKLMAADMIRDSGGSLEEREALADKIDKAVAEKDKAKDATSFTSLLKNSLGLDAIKGILK